MLATLFITTELFLKSTKNENHKVQETKCLSDVQASETAMELGNVFYYVVFGNVYTCSHAKGFCSAVAYRHAQLLFSKRTVGSTGMSTGATLIQGIIYHFVKDLLCH